MQQGLDSQIHGLSEVESENSHHVVLGSHSWAGLVAYGENPGAPASES